MPDGSIHLKGRRKRPGAGGNLPGSALRVIYCGFDRDTMAELIRRARKAKTSTAEQVRQLVELGLETAKEANL